ncbi:MAG TPA: response regulator [Methylococcaceae bacterium]|nr:response regulator [Methylococcaceae bacterium]HIA44631.1 response regulator [Methylococcaceae bacterium]HIN68025.1 response regulator [Methylococcales bacterium]
MLQIVGVMMFFVFIIFALSFFTHIYTQLEQQAEGELRNDLEVMEFMLDEMMARNGALSRRDTVIKGLIDPQRWKIYLLGFLKEQQELFDFDGLAVVNNKGNLIVEGVENNNVLPCLNFNSGHENLFYYRPEERMICFFTPIVIYGSVQGGVLGMINVSKLMRFAKKKNVGLIQLFLGDRLALQLQHHQGRIRIGKTIAKEKNKRNIEDQYFLFESKGTDGLIYVQGLKIRIVNGLRHDVFYLPIIDGLIELLLLTLVVMTITFLLSRHAVKKITKPILLLCEKVSSPDESVLCSPTGTHDELEQLAHVFDKRTQELIDAKSAAIESDHAKSVFLAHMSHEIRTPMNAIIGLAGMLKKSSLDDRQEHYTKNIRSAAGRLLMLINDILDLSKIESGKLTLEMTRFNLHEWAEDLRIIFSNHSKKDVELVFAFDPKIPVYIVGDSLRLSQVCINLLSNAIKFTDEGGIELKLETRRAPNKKILFSCSVTDTGLGMSLAKTQEIFKPFVQAETNTTRKFGGTGLGLSISKQLVELMDGNITCHSKINEGSRFDFTVVMESADSPEANVCFDACKGHKVLLVADQEGLCQQAIMSTLTALSLPVHQLSGGGKALEEIHQAHDVELIIYDCNTQEHCAEGFCRCVYCCSKIIVNNTKPMLVVVDDQDKEKIIPGKEADLYCFIEKPLSTFSLAQGINNFFKEPNPSEALLKGDDIKTKAAENLSGLNILLVEDNDINQEIVIYFLEEYGAQVTLAENGLEAIEATRKQQFDCVLMDLQMPVMNGITATQVIRKNAKYNKIPIIACTADAMPEELKGIKSSGMNARVLKPIDSALLLKTITSLVHDESAMDMAGEGPREDFIS